MKEKVWDNPNKMHFDSPHKTFNKQCSLITTGNQFGNVVYSSYIRSYNEIECNGFINPPGHLQNYDLTNNIMRNVLSPYSWILDEVRKLTHNQGGILYNFHHWKGDKCVDDGFVLTTKDYKLIKLWYINPNWKAKAAVDEAIKYITE